MDTLKPNVRCPICGKYTFKMQNDMEICPVCGWVNGTVQSEEYASFGGSNPVSSDAHREKYDVSRKEAEE